LLHQAVAKAIRLGDSAGLAVPLSRLVSGETPGDTLTTTDDTGHGTYSAAPIYTAAAVRDRPECSSKMQQRPTPLDDAVSVQ
jgi:hypothetical protein